MNERRENTLFFLNILQLVLLERYLQPYKFMVFQQTTDYHSCLDHVYTNIDASVGIVKRHIGQTINLYGCRYLSNSTNCKMFKKTSKNRESIRDATAELQVKIIWSCFINK
jgi:hypothetical protein